MPPTQVLWLKEKPKVVLPVNGFRMKRCNIPNKPYWYAEEVEEAFWRKAKVQAVRTQEVSVAELGGEWPMVWFPKMLQSVLNNCLIV